MKRLAGAGGMVAVGNLLTAALQFVLLSSTSRVGGIDAVGTVSLALAAASVASIFLTSDCKSISLTAFSSGVSIRPVLLFIGVGSLIGLVVGGLFWSFSVSALFLPLLVFKLSQAWGDLAGGLWLVERRLNVLAYSALFKPLFLCVLLLLFPLWVEGNIEALVWSLGIVSCLLVAAELVIFARRLPDASRASLAGAHRDDWRRAFGQFGLLGATGLVTYSPQFIVRDIIGAAFGAAVVGLFSIHYQVLLVATPIVSAASQMVLGKKDLRRGFVLKSGMISLAIGVGSVLVGVAALTVLPVQWVRVIFRGYESLPLAAVLALGLFGVVMYGCVFLGFLSVKLNAPKVQLLSSLFFVSLLGVCWFFRSEWVSISALLFVILGALVGRALILIIGVSRSFLVLRS